MSIKYIYKGYISKFKEHTTINNIILIRDFYKFSNFNTDIEYDGTYLVFTVTPHVFTCQFMPYLIFQVNN